MTTPHADNDTEQHNSKKAEVAVFDDRGFEQQPNAAQHTLVMRWVDRIVRVYAAAALERGGFHSAAAGLRSLRELLGKDEVRDAQHRVDTALETLLLAREVKASEQALVPLFAARASLAIAAAGEFPNRRRVRDVVDALHASQAAVMGAVTGA